VISLGFNGNFEALAQSLFPDAASPGQMVWTHDAAAALVEDGEIVCAIEEERFNRIKHSPKMPWSAIAACLAHRGITLRDVDVIAYNASEANTPRINAPYALGPSGKLLPARRLLKGLFEEHFQARVASSRFAFVEHHLAHAVSAYAYSGFPESLVATVDYVGEGLSGTVGVARGDVYERLRSYAFRTESPGYLYSTIMEAFLGYGPADEYKVMGLAPYGDPRRFRGIFKRFYALEGQGGVRTFPDRFEELREHLRPRSPGQPIRREHRDVAAALQEAFETLLFHMLGFFARETGLRQLSLAGGCAQNSTANGQLLRRRLFDRVFVQPASYDAGGALGAATYAAQLARQRKRRAPGRLTTARLGPDLDHKGLERALGRWEPLVTVERVKDVAAEAARRMAAGEVLGWMQGRSEFGPRALGGRSIVADPRPKANKDRINAMVKKREAFRPFAPSVLAEHANRVFELDGLEDAFGFMTFVVPVRPKFRRRLGAVTHVDGTARIQTVRRDSDPDYWALIEAFRRATGIPLVLNTSFNNNAEPIVESVEDAVACYLTTGLDSLFVGPFLVRRRMSLRLALASLRLQLPPHVQLVRRPRARQEWPKGRSYWGLQSSGWPRWGHGNVEPISRATFDLLRRRDQSLVGRSVSQTTFKELEHLWALRWIRISPA
jgi:carbamoyltransferase